jgi:hypothetical protein
MSLFSLLIKTLNIAIECKRGTTERLYVRLPLLETCKHTSDARTSISGLPAERDAGSHAYQQQHA